ncbi:MAG: mycothiol transferase [Mycobacterium sp.]
MPSGRPNCQHLDHVERFYFLGEEVSDWSATFRRTSEDTIDGVLASYQATVSQANEIIDSCGDLSQPARRSPRPQAAPAMRWILVHMIEERAGTPATPTSCASR